MNHLPRTVTALALGALLATAAGAQQAAETGLNYAYRDLLHTKLSSTPGSAAGSLYNLLHRPTWGGYYSGVASLFLDTTEGGFGCSGSLLSTGRHVLTAAHCVTDSAGQLTLMGGDAFFPSVNTGPYTGTGAAITFAGVQVHPGWSGRALAGGNDLAVITLSAAAPAAANRYQLYTASDEFEQTHTKVGWGQVGTGNGNATFDGGGGLRYGQNTYEASGAFVNPQFGLAANPGLLYYDFDNGFYDAQLGYAPNDAFEFYFGKSHLGVGLNEVIAAPGDSGGPTFINGRIAGVTSFGLTLWNDDLSTADATDPTFGPDSSFGELGGDTRVSYYAGWIGQQQSFLSAQLVPEPGSTALLLAGLALLGGVARKRRG